MTLIFQSRHEDLDIMSRSSPECFVNFVFLSVESTFDIHTVYLPLTEIANEQFGLTRLSKANDKNRLKSTHQTCSRSILIVSTFQWRCFEQNRRKRGLSFQSYENFSGLTFF